MEKLSTVSVGVALGITFAFLSILCAITFALWPDATIGFFNAFTHGLDLNKARTTTPVSFGSVLYGVIGLGIVGFVAGVVFASAYSAFSRS